MSRGFYLVSMPLVVLRNFIVYAPSEDEAMQTVARAPKEWFSRAMHSERFVGIYETFAGVPMKATPLSELGESFDSGPDMGQVS